MSITLRVRMKFHITDEFNEGILFENWLPSEANTLATQVGALRVEVCIDPAIFQVGAFPTDLSLLAEAGDVRIGMIGIDVLIADVPDDVSEFIRLHAKDDFSARQAVAGPLQDAYKALGREVMGAANQTLDIVLAFFRVVKGQFWIPQLYFDPDDLAAFYASSSAAVRSETWDWVRWKPSLVGVIKTEVVDWAWRKARPNDWERLNDFLQAQERPSLTLELMAASELLESEGRARVALIESIAALEVAVRRFLTSTHQATNESLLADLDVRSVEALYEKLGLRGTLAVLLPLLLSDKELPRETLRMSIKAVEIRGAVVHRGKRKLEKDEIRPLLHAVRNLSMLLIDLAAEHT